ncbi:MAG: hypothetical protein CMF25_00105 [Kangiellaceae bacterium]|nr:hypothetical protein [Kangiellaceae bacterium]|tara:strand:- start:39 stop:302 length:264 start_codon:yes stop_codon:yes gene_type:complete
MAISPQILEELLKTHESTMGSILGSVAIYKTLAYAEPSLVAKQAVKELMERLEHANGLEAEALLSAFVLRLLNKIAYQHEAAKWGIV